MRYITPGECRARRGSIKYLDKLKDLARNNRKKMTQGEIIVWSLLRDRKMGYKFLKQKPIDQFILDFYCSKLLLAIDIDGGYHQTRKNYDNGRDHLLSIYRIKTIRITEEEVRDSMLKVKDKLECEIKKRIDELK